MDIEKLKSELKSFIDGRYPYASPERSLCARSLELISHLQDRISDAQEKLAAMESVKPDGYVESAGSIKGGLYDDEWIAENPGDWIPVYIGNQSVPADKPAVAVPKNFQDAIVVLRENLRDKDRGAKACGIRDNDQVRDALNTLLSAPSHSQQSAEVDAQDDDMGGEALAATKIHWDEFEIWWEDHGQYIRAGGGQYEKTFAWKAWNWAIYQNSRKYDRCPSHESEQPRDPVEAMKSIERYVERCRKNREQGGAV